jgi:3-phenylpropionate/cinnamic acid dioxygenase small subunit
MPEGTVDRDIRQDVADVLVRYATAIDRKDWVLFRTCFTDDCAADYGAIGLWHGVDEITEWMAQVHDACGHTMHRITNVAVSTGVGDGVAARSYVEALVLGPDNGAGVRGVGWYDDELVPTDDGWKIARRHFTLVRQEPVPAA